MRASFIKYIKILVACIFRFLSSCFDNEKKGSSKFPSSNRYMQSNKISKVRERNASFIGQASCDDLRIALHYEDAAKILYNSDAYQDGLSLPFLFLVRQFIELTLKYNIRILNHYSSSNFFINKFKASHDLHKLHEAFLIHYNSAKIELGISCFREKKELDKLCQLIEKIARLDNDSQGFRYSANKLGDKMIEIEETFNLKEVYKLLDESSIFLSSVKDIFPNVI